MLAAEAPARPAVIVRTPLVAAGLFGLTLAVFLLNFRYNGSYDTLPNELLPISILREHDLDFDEFVDPAATERLPFEQIGGHYVSDYPILPGLLNLPAYAV